MAPGEPVDVSRVLAHGWAFLGSERIRDATAALERGRPDEAYTQASMAHDCLTQFMVLMRARMA